MSDEETIEDLRHQLAHAIQASEQLADLLRVFYTYDLEVDSTICSEVEDLFEQLKLDL